LVPNWHEFAILNPYWGGDASRFAWNQAALPSGNEEILGGPDEAVYIQLADLAASPREPRTVVLQTATQVGMESAIDLLWATASQIGRVDDNTGMAALAEEALLYSRSESQPKWMTTVEDDSEFIGQFERALATSNASSGAPQSAGTPMPIEILGVREIWDRVREAADRLGSAAGAATTEAVLSVARSWTHRHVATFLGDIFVYLNERGTPSKPGPIVLNLLEALNEADQVRRDQREPLILVAHSMGGNIAYDVLTSFKPDISVDAFITVGSQVGLLEELKLFGASKKEVPANPYDPADRVQLPAAFSRWINVFDRNDILSFSASKIFKGVADYEYATGRSLASAHSTYFNRPSFQDRLGVRLREAWS
jgi:hypothetical protein